MTFHCHFRYIFSLAYDYYNIRVAACMNGRLHPTNHPSIHLWPHTLSFSTLIQINVASSGSHIRYVSSCRAAHSLSIASTLQTLALIVQLFCIIFLCLDKEKTISFIRPLLFNKFTSLFFVSTSLLVSVVFFIFNQHHKPYFSFVVNRECNRKHRTEERKESNDTKWKQRERKQNVLTSKMLTQGNWFGDFWIYADRSRVLLCAVAAFL